MKVVILAAGLGTGLRPLTETTPKPLIEIEPGKPILSYIINHLPTRIEEIIIIVKYLSDQIEHWLKKTYPERRIAFIQQNDNMTGTGGALLSAKDLLKNESRFLVINGDDVLHGHELEEFIYQERAMGVSKQYNHPYFAIRSCESGHLTNMERQTDEDRIIGVHIATGSYVLDSKYFDLEQVINRGGQYSIPETLLKHKDIYPLKIFEFSEWLQINNTTDLENARKKINKFGQLPHVGQN